MLISHSRVSTLVDVPVTPTTNSASSAESEQPRPFLWPPRKCSSQSCTCQPLSGTETRVFSPQVRSRRPSVELPLPPPLSASALQPGRRWSFCPSLRSPQNPVWHNLRLIWFFVWINKIIKTALLSRDAKGRHIGSIPCWWVMIFLSCLKLESWKGVQSPSICSITHHFWPYLLYRYPQFYEFSKINNNLNWAAELSNCGIGLTRAKSMACQPNSSVNYYP